MPMRSSLRSTALVCFALSGIAAAEDHLERIQYNNPGLVVDLGVGLWAWPLPMDYDRDGDLDLVVSCPDKPYNGTYFFENPGAEGPESRVQGKENPQHHPSTLPVFKPAVRIANAQSNVQVSYVNGEPVVMTPGRIYVDFREHQYEHPIKLPLPEKIDPQCQRIRANQWKLIDWEGDGDLDVIIGIGVWDDYGWDDAWDEKGNWKNGPLHGFVYLVENVAARAEGSEQRAEEETVKFADDQSWPEMLGPRPVFAPPVKITTSDGKPVDVYGMPSPNFADFDGDGDLDLICGEFMDGFTYFENGGIRNAPRLMRGMRLSQVDAIQIQSGDKERDSATPLTMDLQMITPTAVDWDGDGDIDLVCGDEDGRVALIANEGVKPNHGRRLPRRFGMVSGFDRPRYFQQQAADVKFGALVTPVSVDWDHDGDDDLVCGNTAGYIGVIENVGDRNPPVWKAPSQIWINQPVSNHVFNSNVLRHQAGSQGSIQGPCEAKWGYTTLSVADWDHDRRHDLIVNDIRGIVTYYRDYSNCMREPGKEGNEAPREESSQSPVFGYRYPVTVAWGAVTPKPEWTWWKPEPGTLVTQWRTTPCVVDWNSDGLSDLIMLDNEGYLALFERTKKFGFARNETPVPDSKPGDFYRPWQDFLVCPPQRVFKIEGPCEFDSRHKPVGDKHDDLLRLNANRAGASGRRKLCFADWDGDGRLDLLVNSVNVNWLRNVRTDDEGFTWFHDEGPLDDLVLAGHTTSPTVVDWDKNGIPDLLVGAEDGHLYYKRNPRAQKP